MIARIAINTKGRGVTRTQLTNKPWQHQEFERGLQEERRAKKDIDTMQSTRTSSPGCTLANLQCHWLRGFGGTEECIMTVNPDTKRLLMVSKHVIQAFRHMQVGHVPACLVHA